MKITTKKVVELNETERTVAKVFYDTIISPYCDTVRSCSECVFDSMCSDYMPGDMEFKDYLEKRMCCSEKEV